MEEASASVVSAEDLVRLIDAIWVSGVVAVALGESMVEPAGVCAVAWAVLLIDPASTSSCVTTYVAVHEVTAPGVRVVTLQVIGPRPGNGSVIVSTLRVTLPVFRTAKV